MRGKWAQGIEPRAFHWIIKGQIAVCERPGGYGANHRKVRRQEEIIWVRENGFTCVYSLAKAPNNLHNYDEYNVPWRHRPFQGPSDGYQLQNAMYEEITEMLAEGQQILVHREELGDHVIGLMGGYLLWADLMPTGPKTITVTEHLVGRRIGPLARELVAAVVDAKNLGDD